MHRAAAVFLYLAACESSPVVEVSDSAQCDVTLATTQPDVVDVLFVVDVRNQEATAAGEVFDRTAALVTGLLARADARAPLWLHAGVVSGDSARGARLEPIGAARFLDWREWDATDTPPGVDPSATRMLRAALGTMPTPAGTRSPLEAMRRVLHDPIPENAGFLRGDSTLIVVLVSDGDDEGTTTPARYALEFTAVAAKGGLRSNPKDTVLALVAGPCAGSAPTITGGPAPRLAAVLDAVGRGRQASLCDARYDAALPSIGGRDFEPSCVIAPLVGTAAEACVVYNEGVNVDYTWRQAVPACDTAPSSPCFVVEPSADCAGGMGVALRSDPGTFAPRGTVTYVSCACDPGAAQPR